MDTLLDTAPCGFLSLRDDGSISLVNRTLQEWLGYPFDELQGQPMDMHPAGCQPYLLSDPPFSPVENPGTCGGSVLPAACGRTAGTFPCS